MVSQTLIEHYVWLLGECMRSSDRDHLDQCTCTCTIAGWEHVVHVLAVFIK